MDWDLEYSTLERTVEDRVGLAAIRALHQQLDDDHDGTIKPSETGDFIKADLKVSGGMCTDLPDSSMHWRDPAVCMYYPLGVKAL